MFNLCYLCAIEIVQSGRNVNRKAGHTISQSFGGTTPRVIYWTKVRKEFERVYLIPRDESLGYWNNFNRDFF